MVSNAIREDEKQNVTLLIKKGGREWYIPQWGAQVPEGGPKRGNGYQMRGCERGRSYQEQDKGILGGNKVK